MSEPDRADPARSGHAHTDVSPPAARSRRGRPAPVPGRPHPRGRPVPGYPCRQCLEDAAVGDELILVSHDPFEHESPYRSASPIFLHREPCQAPPDAAALPAQRTRRQLSVRVFDRDESMTRRRDHRRRGPRSDPGGLPRRRPRGSDPRPQRGARLLGRHRCPRPRGRSEGLIPSESSLRPSDALRYRSDDVDSSGDTF